MWLQHRRISLHLVSRVLIQAIRSVLVRVDAVRYTLAENREEKQQFLDSGSLRDDCDEANKLAVVDWLVHALAVLDHGIKLVCQIAVANF